jgi:hypothetical protein
VSTPAQPAARDVEDLGVLVVRVPCLPHKALPESPFGTVLEQDSRLDETRSVIQSQGRELADAIGQQVPRLGRSARREVLALRRDLYNGRWHLSLAAAAARLPAELRTSVAAWGDRRKALMAAEDDLARACQAASREARQQALNLALAPPADVALAVGHPQLFTAVDRAAAGGCYSRRLDRTLWSLLWRAAYRPTPRGLYCAIALGRWGDTPSDSLTERVLYDTSMTARLGAISSTLAHHPALLNCVEVAATGAASGGPVLTVREPDEVLARVIAHGGWLPGASLLGAAIPPGRVAACVRQGILRLRWRGDGLDQRDGALDDLSRAVVTAAFGDLALLPLLTCLPPEPLRVNGHRDGPAPQVERWKGRTGDAEYAGRLTISRMYRDRFLAEAAWLGAGVAETGTPPARRAARRLIDELGGGRPVGVLDLLTVMTSLLATAGAGKDLSASPEHAAAALGFGVLSSNPLLPAVRAALTGVGPVCEGIRNLVGVGPGTSPRRLSLRFRPLSADGAAWLTFLGSDRGSVTARYVSESPAGRALGRTLRQWFASPDLVDLDVGLADAVDLRPSLTRRRIPGPNAGRTRRDLMISDVVMAPAGEDDIALTDTVGQPVDPVFLGVLAPSRLPTAFRFLLAVGAPPRSALELAIAALNRELTASPPSARSAVCLPAVWMTPNVLLLPPGCVIGGAMLARYLADSGPSRFLRFHRWAREHGCPASRVGVQKLGDGRDPQALDLRYPAGVDALYSHAALSGAGGRLLVTDWEDAVVPVGSGLSGGGYGVEIGVECRLRGA